MLTRFLYFLRKATESQRRAPVLSLATVGMLAVVFLLFDSFALLATNVEHQADRWIDSVKLCLFLADDVEEAGAMALAAKAEQVPEVLSVTYVSRAEAKARFLADFPGNASILDGLPENPLPASLELSVRPEALNVDRLAQLAESFRKEKGVEDAIFGRELFVKLTALATGVRAAYWLVGLMLAAAVLFLTANTIRLNLYARREEILIMQMVGATHHFIRMPFLLEGLIQGACGAGLSLLLLGTAYAFGAAPLAAALSGTFGALDPVFLSWPLLGGIVAGGALLGMLGSLISLGRYWSNL